MSTFLSYDWSWCAVATYRNTFAMVGIVSYLDFLWEIRKDIKIINEYSLTLLLPATSQLQIIPFLYFSIFAVPQEQVGRGCCRGGRDDNL